MVGTIAATASSSWKEEIVNALTSGNTSAGGDSNGGLNVKTLRQMILNRHGSDSTNNSKTAKKTFKLTIQQLEAEQVLQVASDGHVTLVKQKRKKEKTKKKRKQKEEEEEEENDGDVDNDGTKDLLNKKAKTKKIKKEKEESSSSRKKAKKEVKERKSSALNRDDDDTPRDDTVDDGNKVPKDDDDEHTAGAVLRGNPSGITRLFVGNLPFQVDERSLSEFLSDGLTHIKWITDMETGRFYGSAFVEMKTAALAAAAVANKSGTALLGRPNIKINFAPPRPGDVWPPAQKIIKGNGPTKTNASGNDGNGKDETMPTDNKRKKLATAGGVGLAAMGEKPVDCHKLFVGNLSYEIDDDALTKFFAAVEAEVKAIRWIHHKETGFFKGVGFVEFWNTEACEKAATLNGKSLLGRPIRIDWTD